MRLAHLSDLHLGKRVNEFSMLEDQRYILKQIEDILAEEAVQAVLIAGMCMISRFRPGRRSGSLTNFSRPWRTGGCACL